MTVKYILGLPFKDVAVQAQACQGLAGELLLAASQVARWAWTFVPMAEVRAQMAEADWPGVEDAWRALHDMSPAVIDIIEDQVALTDQGVAVALQLALMPVTPADMEPTPEIRPLRVRGSHNGEMRIYAAAVGGRFLKANGERCTFCQHEEAAFVKKGSQLLCQVCFGRNKRPWDAPARG